MVTDRDLRRPKAADGFKSWEHVYRVSDEFQVEDALAGLITETDLLRALVASRSD
jgi:CBS domain-containing protein